MKVPQTVGSFFQAFNNHDADMLLRLLNDNAVVSDEEHDYSGSAAIKGWFEEKAVVPNVTLEPIKAVQRKGMTIVTVQVRGDFDKTGLPDPLKMDFGFTIDADRVTGLRIHFPETRKTIFNALRFWLI